MTKKIDIEDMLQYADAHIGFRETQHTEVALDTNFFKHLNLSSDDYGFARVDIHGNRYDIVVPQSVINEFHHGVNSDRHRVRSAIRDKAYFIHYIDAKVVEPSVSADNEAQITRAWFDINERRGSLGIYYTSDIGVADMQLISYAMDRARQSKNTVILSDDYHVRSTIDELNKNPRYDNRIAAISTKEYKEAA